MSSQVLLSSFPLCTRQAFTTGNPPCLCPRVIWTPRSHLRRKGYQFRGIEKRIPMELPITSILKQNPCKPSHHRNHRPWWENCQVLLRLQLRPQKKKKKKMCLHLQVSGLEVGRIGHSIRLPHRISSPFPTSRGRNLVGGPRQEGKWYINLEEENNSMFTF